MMQAQDEIGSAAGDWRFKLGMAIFVLAFAIWLLMPLVAALNASGTTLAALSGILFISNKALLLVVVAVMGKPGFQQLRRRVFGYVMALAPASNVGPLRHSIGLGMFGLPLFTTFLEPYDDYIWPALLAHSWQVELLSDLIFIASFFVLGGNFWDKIKALFVRTAGVVDLGADTARDVASPGFGDAAPVSAVR
jgi:hypothetical protein